MRDKIISSLAYFLMVVLSRLQRWHVSDPAGVLAAPSSQRFIFAFWHNRLALMPHFGRRFLRGRKLAVMVSTSRDGTLIADIVKRYGIVSVRGSTSKGGPQALRDLADKVAEGFDAGITPDGPRGPRYQAQQGVVGLAQIAGAPIVPLSYRLSWKFQIKKSWDGFFVPLPFARCEFRVGKPIEVPQGATADLYEEKLKEVETALREMGGDGEESQKAKGKSQK